MAKRSQLIILGVLLVSGAVGGILFAIFASKNYENRVMKSFSMVPSIRPGERLVVHVTAYKKVRPKRWDVVVFVPPGDPKARFCMRVVGLPGERVSIGEEGIRIDGKPVDRPETLKALRYRPAPRAEYAVGEPYEVPAMSYFLLGDNTDAARDSRYFGAIHASRITGKVQGK